MQNFIFREKWVGSKVVAGIKRTFFALFDPTVTHIFAPKGPNKEFLKRQKLYYYQLILLTN